MTLKERWREIEEAMTIEMAEAELEDGHEEVFGGSEMPPPEEVDELTAPETGEATEASEGEVYTESASEGGIPLEEVEGFDQECIGEEGNFSLELEDMNPERVFPPDNRVRVGNTRPYPWRTICHLEIYTRTGARGGGTGVFIGPRVVLTAGHCLYLHGHGGWARSIRVTPGANGRSSPYGSAVGTYFISTKGWVNSRNSNYNYGVIVLPSNQRLGNRVGWMGLANLSDSSLRGLLVNSSGYPGDKPYRTQWWNANSILATTYRRLYYRIDTFGGQSGSPVWRYRNGQRHIVGIHTTGGSRYNGATRINRPVFNNLVKWKKL